MVVGEDRRRPSPGAPLAAGTSPPCRSRPGGSSGSAGALGFVIRHGVLHKRRRHELHPADRTLRAGRHVGPELGLDLVDRRQVGVADRPEPVRRRGADVVLDQRRLPLRGSARSSSTRRRASRSWSCRAGSARTRSRTSQRTGSRTPRSRRSASLVLPLTRAQALVGVGQRLPARWRRARQRPQLIRRVTGRLAPLQRPAF